MMAWLTNLRRWIDESPRLSRLAMGLALGLMSLLLVARYFQVTSQISYLAEDNSYYLFCADLILRGQIPYQDFFWHYGPLPLYSFACLGKIAGVSPGSLQLHQGLWNLLAAGLCLQLLRRNYGLTVGLFVLCLTSFCWLTSMGYLYTAMERAGLFALALIWRPPTERSRNRMMTVGCLLGVLQGVKFATAFVAGAAWVLTDLLFLWNQRAFANQARACLTSYFELAVAFIVVETAWIGLAFGFLEPGPATQFLFPLFHLNWYKGYITPDARWFQFHSWKYFLGAILPLLACATSGLWLLVSLVRRRPPSLPAPVSTSANLPMGILLLAIFYGLGTLFFFNHLYNQINYQCLLAPVLGFLLLNGYPAIRLLVILAMLPNLTLLPLELKRQLRASWNGFTPGIHTIAFPNGQSLRLNRVQTSIVRELQEALHHPPNPALAGQPVVILSPKEFIVGSGLHFFLQIPHATRNTWFFSDTIQRWEMESEYRRFCQASAIAIKLSPAQTVTAMENSDSWSSNNWLPFDATRSAAILERFRSPVSTPTGWLIITPR